MLSMSLTEPNFAATTNTVGCLTLCTASKLIASTA